MKPATKSLHTVRVVYQIARMIAQKGKPAPTMYEKRQAYEPDAAGYVLRCVLSILGNEPPTDGELLADCLAVCERALVEEKNERARRAVKGNTPVRAWRCDDGTFDLLNEDGEIVRCNVPAADVPSRAARFVTVRGKPE